MSATDPIYVNVCYTDGEGVEIDRRVGMTEFTREHGQVRVKYNQGSIYVDDDHFHHIEDYQGLDIHHVFDDLEESDLKENSSIENEDEESSESEESDGDQQQA